MHLFYSNKIRTPYTSASKSKYQILNIATILQYFYRNIWFHIVVSGLQTKFGDRNVENVEKNAQNSHKKEVFNF